MITCPYPSHATRHELETNGLRVNYCRGGCGRTLFMCPVCGEANRALSRYCRQCGEAVALETAEAQETLTRPDGTALETNKLSEYGVRTVSQLASYKGLLILTGDDMALFYDRQNVHQPIHQIRSPDRRVIRGITVYPRGDGELCITSSRAVYRLDLLTMQMEPIYSASDGRYITHPVVLMRGEFFVLELDPQQNNSYLVQLTGGDVHSFSGNAQSLMKLSQNRLFFNTAERAFVYSDDIVETKLPERLLETEAAYSPDLEVVYLAGESTILRMGLARQQIQPASLSTRRLNGPHLLAHGNRLFVAHDRGFAILEPFGGVLWQSEQQFISASSDGLNPQIFGAFVLFTSIRQNGGTDLRVHSLNNLGDYKTYVYDQRFLCPPLLMNRRIVSVNGEFGAASLNAMGN
jgi:hypothetical protein